MLTGNDEYPELKLGGSNGIFISKKQSLYYRIDIKGVPSPLKCQIIYSNIEAKSSSLDIYFSGVSKQPNYSEHEVRIKGNNSKFFVSAKNIGSTRQDKDDSGIMGRRNKKANQNPLYEMRK